MNVTPQTLRCKKRRRTANDHLPQPAISQTVKQGKQCTSIAPFKNSTADQQVQKSTLICAYIVIANQ